MIVETRGKRSVYKETFISPFEKEQKADALKVLDEIRTAHPATAGWVEDDGYVEQLANGKWRAIRKHRKLG